jgi:glutamine synthetase
MPGSIQGERPIAKSVKEVPEMSKNTQTVDSRFFDLPGTWQHFTMPTHRLTENFFEEGIPFDGSSIRGFQENHESDMLLKADPDTAFIDPTAEISTLVLSSNVYDPLTFEAYSRDPVTSRSRQRRCR